MKKTCFWENITGSRAKISESRNSLWSEQPQKTGLRACKSLVWFQQSFCWINREIGEENNAAVALLQISDLKSALWTAVTDDVSRTWVFKKACCSLPYCLWTKLDVTSDSCAACTLFSMLSKSMLRTPLVFFLRHSSAAWAIPAIPLLIE